MTAFEGFTLLLLLILAFSGMRKYMEIVGIRGVLERIAAGLDQDRKERHQREEEEAKKAKAEGNPRILPFPNYESKFTKLRPPEKDSS